MFRIKKVLLLSFFILNQVYVVSGNAAIINAADCSQSAVQSAINSASNGDTVKIPNGNCTWSSSVTINKPLTLMVNGLYGVDVNHNDVGTWPLTITLSGNVGIDITGAPGQNIRVTGFYFNGAFVDYGFEPNGANGAIRIQNSSRSNSWRIDNCKFVPSSGSGQSIAVKYSYGVIDHCYFDNGGAETSEVIQISRFGSSLYGNESFTDPVDFGSVNFVFIEDNTFWRSLSGGSGSPAAVDAQCGGRYVFRYNYARDSFIVNHGTESNQAKQRSGYAFEAYNNTFSWNVPGNPYMCAFFVRGGTWLIHHNTLATYQAIAKFWVHRVVQTGGDFQACDGTRSWDGNAGIGDAPGYPCLDQVGRGQATSSNPFTSPYCQPQESSEVRIWHNTATLTRVCNATSRNSGATCHLNPTYTIEGRDYEYSTDDTAALPGYAPYIYPHPLQMGGDITPPGPPKNLRVQ